MFRLASTFGLAQCTNRFTKYTAIFIMRTLSNQYLVEIPYMRIVQEALTFDDVLLLPAHSTVLPKDVSLNTRLTRGIELKIPLISAAMDTVTEARLAISMAQAGGIGIIHKNMDLQQQAQHVSRVKKYESGVIKDPITVPPSTSIREVIQLTQSSNISGVPVVDGEE